MIDLRVKRAERHRDHIPRDCLTEGITSGFNIEEASGHCQGCIGNIALVKGRERRESNSCSFIF